MFEILSLLFGVASAYPYLYLAHIMTSVTKRRHLLGTGLVGAAVAYIMFALLWGRPNENDEITIMSFSSVMWLEVTGLAVYGSCYPLAIVFQSDLWLALGWVLHPLWDMLLHWGKEAPASHVAPQWYVLTCASFDVAVAGYIVWVQQQQQQPHEKKTKTS